MTDDNLRRRYGKHAEEKGIDVLSIRPNPMFIKDLACSCHAFKWSDYEILRSRFVKIHRLRLK